MRLIAYDPFVSDDRAKKMSVELLDLDQVVADSDFLTIHLPKTPETLGLINAISCSRRSRACASSTSPAAASSTRPTSPSVFAKASSPAPPSTCSTPSR
jgi:hypothetical protein